MAISERVNADFKCFHDVGTSRHGLIAIGVEIGRELPCSG